MIKQEERISKALLDMLEDQSNIIKEIALEAFKGGILEAKLSRGNFNISDVFPNVSYDKYDDPAEVGVKSKAIGFFTGSLQYEDFILKILDRHYYSQLKIMLTVLKDKGFRIDDFAPLIIHRARLFDESTKRLIKEFPLLNIK